MTDKKLTDNEIAKTIPLESQIEHCNERIKEVFDSYYRRHTDGGEEPLNICGSKYFLIICFCSSV